MPITHQDLIGKFIDHLKFQKRYSQHTIDAYQNDLIAFFDYIEFQYAGLPLSELGPFIVKSWLAKLNESGKELPGIEMEGAGIKSRSANHKILPLSAKS
ncbi:MAG: site-specific integrase, partial [Ferruginibacter sp.]